LVDAVALTSPVRLVQLCKDILEAKDVRKIQDGSAAFTGVLMMYYVYVVFDVYDV